MVSKFCFELDKKGILPFWFENEYIYLKRGENLIKKYEYFDLEDAFEKTKIEDKGLLRYKFCGPIEKEKIKEGAESVLAKYCYDLSWVKGVYFKDTYMALYRAVVERRFVGGTKLGDAPLCGSYDGYLLPFIAINAEPDNPIIGFAPINAKAKNKIISKTINHELMHVAKSDIYPIDNDGRRALTKRAWSYEETFADSINYKISIGRNRQLIKKAKETLEEPFGESAGYVLGRLTYNETKDIAHSNENPIAFIDREAKNSLRLQIIKEKLEKG